MRGDVKVLDNTGGLIYSVTNQRGRICSFTGIYCKQVRKSLAEIAHVQSVAVELIGMF